MAASIRYSVDIPVGLAVKVDERAVAESVLPEHVIESALQHYFFYCSSVRDHSGSSPSRDRRPVAVSARDLVERDVLPALALF
jgi:hypothetical protein